MLLPTLTAHQYRPRGSPVTSPPAGAPLGKRKGIFPLSTTSQAAPPSSDHDHVNHIPSSSTKLRPRPHRPHPEQLHRGPTTSTTSQAALPSSDHADHDHIPRSSAEPRPHRPPDHVAMMIAAKNGATTIATTVMATGRKARGPDNFIATNQMSIQR